MPNRKLNPLSIGRLEILRQFMVFRSEQGYPPTHRELAAAVSLSQSTVQYHLNILAEAGYIKLSAPGKRSIKVLKIPDELKEYTHAQ